MKPVLRNFSTTQSQKIFTALILTSVVSVGSGLALIKSSTAAYTRLGSETAKESLKENATSDRLPSQVADAVLRNASEESGLPTRALNIMAFTRTQWARFGTTYSLLMGYLQIYEQLLKLGASFVGMQER